MSEHKWDRDGERCIYCGDKDWMGTSECRGPQPKEHVDSSDCWCIPRLDFVGPEGTAVYVHHEPN